MSARADLDSAVVGRTFIELFHALHDRFREQIRGLDDGTLNWRPLPKANSIAVLVIHSLGSEREIVGRRRRSPLSAESRDSRA